MPRSIRFRKPELIPLLLSIGAFALLFSLGVWQVERLQWKNALVVQIEKAQSLPPLTMLPDDVAGLEYRHARLTGTFHYDKSLHTIGAAPSIGIDAGSGFHIVTPFTLKDGRTILVDRGWSPLNKETTPPGVQTITGIIRPPHPKATFAPENRLDKNVWFYDDISAMSHFTGLKLTPLIVQLVGEQKRDVYPIPSDGKLILRNDHLQYAITWFSIALIGLVMFGFYHRMPEEKS